MVDTCLLLLLCVRTIFHTVPSSMCSCLELSFTPLPRVSRMKVLNGVSQSPSASRLTPCFWQRDTMTWQSVIFKGRGSTFKNGMAAFCLLLRRGQRQKQTQLVSLYVTNVFSDSSSHGNEVLFKTQSNVLWLLHDKNNKQQMYRVDTDNINFPRKL